MKALIGSWEHRPYRLLAENTALRSKVAELREELARAHEENAALRERLSSDEGGESEDDVPRMERPVDIAAEVEDIEVVLSSG